MCYENGFIDFLWDEITIPITIIRNRVSQKILEDIEKSESIKIASQTVDIVGFPEVRLTQLQM